MEQSVSTSGSSSEASQPKTCYNQPVMSSPWMTQQPQEASPGTSRNREQSPNRPMQPSALAPDPTARPDGPFATPSSLKTSTSHFFYFLRLMQMFPDTHPATLHTVLTLCKNDFFRAFDKLLYAKRYKTLYSRGMGVIKRCPPKKSISTILCVYSRRAYCERAEGNRKKLEHPEDVPSDKRKLLNEPHKPEVPPAQSAPQCEVPDRESPLREEEKAMIANDLSNMEKNVIDNNLDALENHDGFDSANGLNVKTDISSGKLETKQNQEISQECEVICLKSSSCSQLVKGDKIIFMW